MEQARVLAASRRMFIDGQWVEAWKGGTYATPTPATEEPIGTAPDATVDDMRRAIAAARRAFDDGPWPRTSHQDRARVLNAIADGMERRKEELRQLVIAEAGATYLTHEIQIEHPITMMRHYAELALSFEFEEQLPTRVSHGMLGTQVNSGIVYRHPAGVCGMIPTWNFPLFVTVQKLGPALATGCTMVFKPSPYGPLINLFLAGQGCAMTTRVLIPRDAHDTLVQKMVDFVQGMVKVGDPADPSTFLGPVIREERREKIEEYIESGKREGAVLAHGGGRPKDLRRGYFLEPTIFCAVPNRIRIAQGEIFGPVVSVIPFTDEDEAIRIPNDSPYGPGRMGLTRG